MPITSMVDLLQAFLHVTKPSEVAAILDHIGDDVRVPVDTPFGDLGLQWHFFSDNPSNMSTINLGSKPGRSLTERVTNAIDAVLEREMYLQGDANHPPATPMEAAEAWFGRPPTSANSGLYQLSTRQINDYANQINIVMMPGDEDVRPSIDMVDSGIGIHPDDFSDTILSFHRGNKISKRYLAGAFGQGGSATIAFCNYTLIMSRRIDTPGTLGFTLVKLMELEDDYKENAYVYLTVRGDDGRAYIPTVHTDAVIDLYPAIKPRPKELPDFATGTLVRHYGYRLEGLERPLSTSTRNLYHALNYMLVDPLLPFRITDVRKKTAHRSEIVIGTRNRLMRGEAGVEIRHHQPRFWLRPLPDEPQSLGVEYWVVFAPGPPDKDGKPTQRARPHDLFVDPNHPVIATLNGQNHGELTGRIVREAKLPQVAKHIIVHFDLSHISKRVRSSLLSSTREGFKEGEVLSEIVRVVQDHFRDDEHLHELEAELQESLVQSESNEANEEVRKQITRLLRDKGLDFGKYGQVPVLYDGVANNSRSKSNGTSRKRREKLPTLPYPQVSRFEIVRPQPALRIHYNDTRLIRVETDADTRFDRTNALRIRVAPRHLADVSKGSLVGGRINWRLRPTADAKPGDIGTIIVSLMLPDGRVLEDRLPYEILPPREQRIKTARGYVPQFEVHGIDPVENPEHFFRIWDYLDPAEADVTSVAYRLIEAGNSIAVYYNKSFGAYRKRLDEIVQRKPALAQQFVQNYEIWIGYYAILQWQQSGLSADLLVDEDAFERLQDNERMLVAEMQVKQAAEVAQLLEAARVNTEEQG